MPRNAVFPNTKGIIINKPELITAVTETSDLSKAEANKAIEAIFDAITNSLKDGETIQMIGFGSFSVSDRAAREGRNPRTGEIIQIVACKQAKFKAGKAFKEAVNA